MKKDIFNFKKLILIAGIAFLSINAYNQNNLVMYHMDRLPQSITMNPAIQPKPNGYINFPLLSTVGLNLSSGFALSTFIDYDETLDSLVIRPSSEILDKLPQKISIGMDLQEDLIGFGFRAGTFYFSLNSSFKFSNSVGIPKGFPALFLEGNGAYRGADNPLDLSGLGVNSSAYFEIGIGVSKEIIDGLTVGIRPKYLQGVYNIYSRKTDLLWKTGSGYPTWIFENDFEYNISIPGIVLDVDSLASSGMDENISNTEIVEQVLSNRGFGLDIGGIYEFTEKITFSASVLDMGGIKWAGNPQTLTSQGTFSFSGLDVNGFLDTSNTDIATDLRDSLLDAFSFTKDTLAYRAPLGTKIYLGSHYQFTDNIGFGAIVGGRFISGSFKPVLSLSANLKAMKMLAFSASYSMLNRSYANVGLGMALNLAGLQFYLMSDNVSGMVFPQHAKNINLRFGLNIVFGYGDRGKKKGGGSNQMLLD